MYYENKKSFYIRQYGPPVIAICISIVLIAGGLFIATKSLENDVNKQQIAKLTNTNTSINISSNMPKELQKLKSFTKSKKYNVYSISSDNSIIIEVSKNKYFSINLIGINNSKENSLLKNKMEEDLLNKKINIEFDNSKIDKDKVYAYIYLDNELYNTKLLKNGYATLRVERRNVDKLDVLLGAEKEAKNASLGIWKL